METSSDGILAARFRTTSELDPVAREIRASELRNGFRQLAEGDRALALARLVETDKARALEAIAAVVDRPLPVDAGDGQLAAISRGWIERYDPGRAAGPVAARMAVQVLEAAVSRAGDFVRLAAEGSTFPEPVRAVV